MFITYFYNVILNSGAKNKTLSNTNPSKESIEDVNSTLAEF